MALIYTCIHPHLPSCHSPRQDLVQVCVQRWAGHEESPCWSWSWCWCWRWMWLMVLQGLISNIRLLRLWPDIPAMQPIKSFTNLFQIISLTQPKVLSDKEDNDDNATWWSSTLPPPHPSWWPRLHPMRGDHSRRIWEERLSRGEDLSKEWWICWKIPDKPMARCLTSNLQTGKGLGRPQRCPVEKNIAYNFSHKRTNTLRLPKQGSQDPLLRLCQRSLPGMSRYTGPPDT